MTKKEEKIEVLEETPKKKLHLERKFWFFVFLLVIGTGLAFGGAMFGIVKESKAEPPKKEVEVTEANQPGVPENTEKKEIKEGSSDYTHYYLSKYCNSNDCNKGIEVNYQGKKLLVTVDMTKDAVYTDTNNNPVKTITKIYIDGKDIFKVSGAIGGHNSYYDGAGDVTQLAFLRNGYIAVVTDGFAGVMKLTFLDYNNNYKVVKEYSSIINFEKINDISGTYAECRLNDADGEDQSAVFKSYYINDKGEFIESELGSFNAFCSAQT